MQTANNYDLEWTKYNGLFNEQGSGVFNGDIGYIQKIVKGSGETTIIFEDGRECIYPRSQIGELSLAYAITIHKSQGSEYPFVIIPMTKSAPLLLTRNLLYTAITRAQRMVILLGDKSTFAQMVENDRQVVRNTGLYKMLRSNDDKA